MNNSWEARSSCTGDLKVGPDGENGKLPLEGENFLGFTKLIGNFLGSNGEIKLLQIFAIFLSFRKNLDKSAVFGKN